MRKLTIVFLLLAGCGTSTAGDPDPLPTVSQTTVATTTTVRPTTTHPTTTKVIPKPKAPTPTRARPRPRATAPPTDPRYGTCKEAISHGYGPYYQGQDIEYS